MYYPLYDEGKLVQSPGIEPGSMVAYLVGGLGIEPSSTALQAVAEITRLAHLPKTFHTVLLLKLRYMFNLFFKSR